MPIASAKAMDNIILVIIGPLASGLRASPCRGPQEDEVLPFIDCKVNPFKLKFPNFNVNASDLHESIPPMQSKANTLFPSFSSKR